MRIGLVTCAKLPEPDPDAPLLHDALVARGHQPVLLAWDRDAGEIEPFDRVLLRSPWNYYRAPRRFLEWLERVDRETHLLNPLDVVRWNVHKRYLLELEARGVSIVPSCIVERGATSDVRDVVDKRGWEDVVVKPCISAASWRTRRFPRGHTEEAAQYIGHLARDGDVLVQPFLPGAVEPGERSLVWVDGVLTHAIRKRPHFDGQDESVTADGPPTAEERAMAGRILGPIADRIAYARIDVFPDRRGRPLVSEVELIEPSLFFRHGPEALTRLVARLEQGSDARV